MNTEGFAFFCWYQQLEPLSLEWFCPEAFWRTRHIKLESFG